MYLIFIIFSLMKIKIFHTSDLHIGQKLLNLDNENLLYNARFETLDKLISTANDNDCGFFVVAGDLFNTLTVTKTEVSRVVNSLNNFSGEAVLVLPGNHDFYTTDNPKQLWMWFEDMINSNTVLLKTNKIYNFGMINFYPAHCTSKKSSNNNLDWIKNIQEYDNNAIHVGIAHGSLENVSPDMKGEYFPMKIKELDSAFIDVWLLGHTHIPYPENNEQSRYYFAGTPEPDGFDCKHKGTARIIEIDKNKNIKSEIIQTGKYYFLKKDHADIYNSNDIKSIEQEYTKKEYNNAFLRLNLSGSLTEKDYDLKFEIEKKINENVTFLDFIDNDLNKQISEQRIHDEFTKDSLPYKILMELENTGNNEALQIAFDLIQEVKRDNY